LRLGEIFTATKTSLFTHWLEDQKGYLINKSRNALTARSIDRN
jgi:hypothetical protein